MTEDYTFPTTVEESYVKGSFIDCVSDTITFEIHAVFLPDGSCDEEATLAKVRVFIDQHNRYLQMRAKLNSNK